MLRISRDGHRRINAKQAANELHRELNARQSEQCCSARADREPCYTLVHFTKRKYAYGKVERRQRLNPIRDADIRPALQQLRQHIGLEQIAHAGPPSAEIDVAPEVATAWEGVAA